MPLYSFVCEKCAVQWDEFQGRDVKHVASCPECGVVVKQKFMPPSFRIDFTAGWDPGLGQYVDTKRERENIVARDELKRVKD